MIWNQLTYSVSERRTQPSGAPQPIYKFQMHLSQPKHRQIKSSKIHHLSGHLLNLCPVSLHPLHLGIARVRGSKVGEALLCRGGGGALSASTGTVINWQASCTKRPTSASICFLDLACFCFCFLLVVCNSLFSLASKIILCIVRRKPFISWFNVRSDGLGRLRDLVWSKALIDKACRRSSFSVASIFSVKL